MKKIVALVLCLCLAVMPFMTSCHKNKVTEKKKVKKEKVEEVLYEVEDIPYEFKTDGTELTAKIIKYIGEGETSVELPSEITDAKTGEKCTVTELADGVFFGNEEIENVVIPEGVTKIGVGVFQNCASLKSVTLPSTLETIGDRAFFNCTKLTDLEIPAKVSSIGYMAFSDYFVSCPWYDQVTSQTTAIVGDGILLKYSGNSDVTFGDEVKHVAYYAFADSTVANATFSSALETIDAKAFLGSSTKLHLAAGSNGANDASANSLSYELYEVGEDFKADDTE